MNKLLKDAIADAKAVRETALANAKFALEEAFAPKIQSMISHKIKEEMEEEMEEEESDEVEVESGDEQMEQRMRVNAGLEEEDDIFGDEAGEGSTETAGDDPEALGEVDHEEEAYEESEEDMSDADLEELIRELEGDDEVEAEEPAEPKEEEEIEVEADMEEDFFFEGEDGDEDEQEVDLEEIIRALREEDEEGGDDEERAEKAEEDLEEAYKVIKFLRSKLNEVNLLNAKLLYVNKLIKKEGLTEGQKVKIIETFDRARNVREAKLIYTTLAESVNKRSVVKAPVTKTKMVEGFASKSQKPTTKILSENKVYNRFTELVKFNR